MVAELVSVGHWSHSPPARGPSQLPYTHAIKVGSPSTLVRNGAYSPKCRGQLSCEDGASSPAFIGPAKGQAGSGWLSDFIIHGSHGPLRWHGPHTSIKTPDAGGPWTQSWPLTAWPLVLLLMATILSGHLFTKMWMHFCCCIVLLGCNQNLLQYSQYNQF